MTSTIETPTDQKSKEEEKDWIDNVCEKTTNLLCPVPDDLPEALAAAENKKEEADEDMLDYVFTKVESITCGEEAVKKLTGKKDVEQGDSGLEIVENKLPWYLLAKHMVTGIFFFVLIVGAFVAVALILTR